MLRNVELMHKRAGKYYGKLSACGHKIDYGSEESAVRNAEAVSAKSNRKLEAYPCYFCNGWHIGREMTQKEREVFSQPGSIEMELINIDVAEPGYGVQEGIQGLRVHNRAFCEGEYCSIHNPSDHPLKDAPLNWRADRRIMERFCKHGVGHPDPDDSHYRKRRDGNRYDSGIHGCDGCC